MAYKVSRFALMYSPPTLMVEFNDPADDSKYVKKINLKNIANVKKSDTLVSELRAKYPTLLGPNIVEEAQIKGLVERLMAYTKKTNDTQLSQNNTLNSNNNSTNDSSQPAASTTVMFKRVSAPTSESELQNLDLNVVSDEVNKSAKRIMDTRFEANRLKPGDEGYQWDKAVDFDTPTEAAGWDDEDESGESN